MTESKSNRTSRESGAHDNQTRRKPWRPVRKLETPEPPRWLYLPVDSGIHVGSGRQK